MKVNYSFALTEALKQRSINEFFFSVANGVYQFSKHDLFYNPIAIFKIKWK